MMHTVFMCLIATTEMQTEVQVVNIISWQLITSDVIHVIMRDCPVTPTEKNTDCFKL